MHEHYTTFEYYSNEYCGGKPVVIATDFPKLLLNAQSIIDMYTFNRIRELSTVLDDIQYCCCELIERINSYESRLKENPSGITSEKIKNYSVSYESSENMKKKFEDDTRNIVYKWLGRTGLLYRGCY